MLNLLQWGARISPKFDKKNRQNLPKNPGLLSYTYPTVLNSCPKFNIKMKKTGFKNPNFSLKVRNCGGMKNLCKKKILETPFITFLQL